MCMDVMQLQRPVCYFKTKLTRPETELETQLTIVVVSTDFTEYYITDKTNLAKQEYFQLNTSKRIMWNSS